jgi:3',5'-cyclic AMP phosphodiesterase CpdA
MSPMLILHLSDLHFGAHSRFKGRDVAKLGKSFFQDLNAVRGDFAKGSRIDLVAVTGDIAESGRPTEFKDGELFLAALAGELGLDRRRFVFVPGNHDVSWPACKKVAADQEEEGFDENELRRRMDQVKLGRYEEFLQSFYGVKDLAEVALPLGRGAYLYSFPDLYLSVAALNTCEKESHRRSDHMGFLSPEQAEALMGEWRSSGTSGWLKIATLHHNPVVTVPSNISSWRKEIEEKGLASDLAARYEGDVVGFDGREHLKAIVEDAHVQLVLHGHHHAKDEQSWDWRRGAKGRAAVLSSGSLTLSGDKLPEDEPLSLRLIELDTGRKEIRARSLIYDPRGRTKGELHRGSFVPDPVEPDGYRQHLDLPSGFAFKQTRKTAKSAATAGSSAFVRNYRQSLVASYSRWDLAPVGVAQTGGAGKPIEAGLDEMYQPLRLAEGFNIDHTEIGEPITPEALLSRKRPLAIRGAAGAGKTTWMRWTFRRLLREERALPLMLVVRDLARYWQSPGSIGAARSLVSFLDAWAAERMGAGWEGELHKIIEAGDGPRPILLVDGWDEAGKLGEDLREKLVGLLAKCPRMLVVVTSRPYGEGRPSHAEGFEVLDVQPLANSEIQDFSRRFYSHCYGEDAITAAKGTELFWNALERSPEPLALARTALLLTMMLLIGRSRPLPDKRHLLYEACIDNLLTALPDRKAEEGALLLPEQSRPEDSEERKRVVARLAFVLQEEGYKGYNRSAIVRDWEGMAAILPVEWETKKKMGFLAWLAGPAGLLTDRADGTLTFTHLSFQEYLAAWHLNATTEGPEERIQGFKRKDSLIWWETLRLWAALIERQSPERLDPVLESLMIDDAEGLAFAGTILADGLGSESRFEEWKERWLARLVTEWTSGTDQCVRSWAASRQEARKEALASRLHQHISQTNWLGWVRVADFLEEAAMPTASVLPNSLVNRHLVEALTGETIPSASSVAAIRILCSGPSLWPVDPLELGLLQVWPGERRIMGLRLQSAVALGGLREELKKLIHFWSQREVWNSTKRDFSRNLFRDFSRDFSRKVSRDFSRKVSRDFSRNLSRYLSRDLSRYFSRYFSRGFSRYFALEFSRDLSRGFSRYFSRDFSRYFSRYFSRDFSRDFFRDFFRDFSRDFSHDLSRYLSRDFSRDFARDFAHYFAHYFAYLAHDFDDKKGPFKYGDFLTSELLSFGRVGVRSMLGHVGKVGQISVVRVLAPACRLSLHPGEDDHALNEALASYEAHVDPLWLALARHLARRATPEDHALLQDLAQHPEKREPPLSWGLQFIVRGDVLFDDGSVVTLDELCDEAGVPRLPYLEDLPDELEVDWEG